MTCLLGFLWLGSMVMVLMSVSPHHGGLIFGLMFWVLGIMIPVMEYRRRYQPVIYNILLIDDLSEAGHEHRPDAQ